MPEQSFDPDTFIKNAQDCVLNVLRLIGELNHPDRNNEEIAAVYDGAVARGIDVWRFMNAIPCVEDAPTDATELSHLHLEYTALGVIMGIALGAADRREPRSTTRTPLSEILKIRAESRHADFPYAPDPIEFLEL